MFSFPSCFIYTWSQYSTWFKSYCCEADNILRKSSNLILNLFHLMTGSNIPDIASDPKKGILKLQEKFTLARLVMINIGKAGLKLVAAILLQRMAMDVRHA